MFNSCRQTQNLSSNLPAPAWNNLLPRVLQLNEAVLKKHILKPRQYCVSSSCTIWCAFVPSGWDLTTEDEDHLSSRCGWAAALLYLNTGCASCIKGRMKQGRVLARGKTKRETTITRKRDSVIEYESATAEWSLSSDIRDAPFFPSRWLHGRKH